MCVQCSQKQKREREREREHDDKKRMLVILSRSLCSSFLRLFFSCVNRELSKKLSLFCGDAMRSFSSSLCLVFKNFSQKKNSPPPQKRYLRGVNVKCRNEKQRRRIWVVLNRRVLRASTRETDVRMRVKGLIVAYGRRT